MTRWCSRKTTSVSRSRSALTRDRRFIVIETRSSTTSETLVIPSDEPDGEPGVIDRPRPRGFATGPSTIRAAGWS